MHIMNIASRVPCLVFPFALQNGIVSSKAASIRKLSSAQRLSSAHRNAARRNDPSDDTSMSTMLDDSLITVSDPNTSNLSRNTHHRTSDHLFDSSAFSAAASPTPGLGNCKERKWYMYQSVNGNIYCTDGNNTVGDAFYDSFLSCCDAQSKKHGVQECLFEPSTCGSYTTHAPTTSPTTAEPTEMFTACADRSWYLSNGGVCSNFPAPAPALAPVTHSSLLDCCTANHDSRDVQTCKYVDTCAPQTTDTPSDSPVSHGESKEKIMNPNKTESNNHDDDEVGPRAGTVLTWIAVAITVIW
eukprot:CAMPEP_0183710624 /NCGR_PEP_ID=MMETSP0737-20130205/6311_1 /TAXON_ID=385413 /ORGANISM="Thalassiosira miniscula, Strain CCMP1093" /LENGTH=298 /DNA_ID=CAMNT_0025938935 /DNA_START=66 /DNA_END=959 /DNA_ORIENTATION=-